MPAWLGPAIAGVAGLIGGERTNRVNQREAQINRDFQGAEAEKARKFSERMRNTEWQAAVADMEAAGINPAVAYSQGGAAAPSGAMAGGTSTPGATDPVSSAAQSAMQAKSLKLLDSQIKKAQGEAETAKAIGDRETARNRAYGFQVRPNGSIAFDYEMPGLLTLVRAEVEGAAAGASSAQQVARRNRYLANTAGIPGEAAARVLPAFNLADSLFDRAKASSGRAGRYTLYELKRFLREMEYGTVGLDRRFNTNRRR